MRRVGEGEDVSHAAKCGIVNVAARVWSVGSLASVDGLEMARLGVWSKGEGLDSVVGRAVVRRRGTKGMRVVRCIVEREQ